MADDIIVHFGYSKVARISGHEAPNVLSLYAAMALRTAVEHAPSVDKYQFRLYHDGGSLIFTNDDLAHAIVLAGLRLETIIGESRLPCGPYSHQPYVSSIGNARIFADLQSSVLYCTCYIAVKKFRVRARVTRLRRIAASAPCNIMSAVFSGFLSCCCDLQQHRRCMTAAPSHADPLHRFNSTAEFQYALERAQMSYEPYDRALLVLVAEVLCERMI
ncbi:hypothetical protein JKP88DRAFT_241856 [Tribonema minus]|uniref:Uncharacterized protein n=1 Tax=Tribonema minus TaxID=303371 RepID=A0A836CB14_9STRA|nr:hypothetical protein JKP88DRAFT_241856 [Tribonema minus]